MRRSCPRTAAVKRVLLLLLLLLVTMTAAAEGVVRSESAGKTVQISVSEEVVIDDYEVPLGVIPEDMVSLPFSVILLPTGVILCGAYAYILMKDRRELARLAQSVHDEKVIRE